MMHLLAPAKINLHLRVGRRRDDGFHPLLTWMCTVGLFDRLTLEADADLVGGVPPADERAGTGSEPPGDARRESVGLSICGDGDRPDLPRDGRNLVVRIATAFVDELRRDRAAGKPAGRGSPAAPPGPAFRKEGYLEPESETPGGAWAAPRTGAGSTASAGATPKGTPGNVGEDSPVSGIDVMREQAAAGSAGVGVGVVREAEGSGRSDRRDGGGVEGSARGAGRPDALSNAAAPGAAHDPRRGAGRDAARDLARGEPGGAGPAVRVALDKRVPIGAGLGGGSSDAAHTLVALDRLLNAGWAAERLSSFAARFGSDVPFFVSAALGSASCACRGRGEIVRPVARPRAKWAVVFSGCRPATCTSGSTGWDSGLTRRWRAARSRTGTRGRSCRRAGCWKSS